MIIYFNNSHNFIFYRTPYKDDPKLLFLLKCEEDSRHEAATGCDQVHQWNPLLLHVLGHPRTHCSLLQCKSHE